MSNPYSFKDGSGAFSHPSAGDYMFAGQIGLNQITFRKTQEKTLIDPAADGTPMISRIAGHLGQIDIEVQQTSDAHKFFLYWSNLIEIAEDANDVSNSANATVTWRSLTDGLQWIAQGVAPLKNPDHPFAQRGQNVVWTLVCADLRAS